MMSPSQVHPDSEEASREVGLELSFREDLDGVVGAGREPQELSVILN